MPTRRSSKSRTSAWWGTCSRCCRSWSRRSPERRAALRGMSSAESPKLADCTPGRDHGTATPPPLVLRRRGWRLPGRTGHFATQARQRQVDVIGRIKLQPRTPSLQHRVHFLREATLFLLGILAAARSRLVVVALGTKAQAEIGAVEGDLQ